MGLTPPRCRGRVAPRAGCSGTGGSLCSLSFSGLPAGSTSLDLSDVVATLEKKHRKQVELARRSTYNPFTKKQFALSDMWVPDPGNYYKEI